MLSIISDLSEMNQEYLETNKLIYRLLYSFICFTLEVKSFMLRNL